MYSITSKVIMINELQQFKSTHKKDMKIMYVKVIVCLTIIWKKKKGKNCMTEIYKHTKLSLGNNTNLLQLILAHPS